MASDWSPWVRRLYFGLWGYAAFQWLRGGGPIRFSVDTAAGARSVLLLASMWLKLCDDTRLDCPSDPAP